ncbi:MAG: hypothetical protein ACK500_14220 [Flavobacteriales bacterium]|jgi:hypothetical protein
MNLNNVILVLLIVVSSGAEAQWLRIESDSSFTGIIRYYRDNTGNIEQIEIAVSNQSSHQAKEQIWIDCQTRTRIIIRSEDDETGYVKWLSAKRMEQESNVWVLDGLCYFLNPSTPAEIIVYGDGWIVP